MGKHGPCRHCGVTSTPLWRNGPPEKPVLCNACGSRWRTKGSLVNYTPLHAREPFEWEEPKITKSKSLPFKNTEQKLPKRKRMVENVREIPFSESGQNYIRTFEGDFSNRSSSGSAISYSESCANFGVVDASDWSGSAQSNACASLLPVPSKKRTIINLKPSPVEKLTKDLYSIWHEQQSSNLSGSLEEELLFEGEMPMGSAEMGHGGVLLRYPSSKATEEESEASSLPADNKLVGGPFSRSSILVDSESRRTSLSNSSVDKFKNFTGTVAQDHTRRDRFSLESLDMLQNRESLLRFTDLKDIINLEVFTKHMKNEEQQQLLKYLPSIDTTNPPESLGSMFSSPQFLENLSYYQQHLQNGIFDLSSSQMTTEENRNLKRLLLLNFTKSRWVEHYNEMKGTTYKQSTGVNKGDRTNFLRHSNLKPIKRSHECQYQQSEESKGTMRSPKRVCRSNSSKHSLTKSSLLLPNQAESIEFADTESFLDNGGTCFSPRSLFAPLTDQSSMLQFADDSSDQGVLLDVRCSASFPEAELYHRPWDQKAASNNSRAESCAVAEEESLCSFPDSSFAGKKTESANIGSYCLMEHESWQFSFKLALNWM